MPAAPPAVEPVDPKAPRGKSVEPAVALVVASGDEDGAAVASAVTARMVLADGPRATRAGRRFLREFLARAHVPDEIAGNAERCVSELVASVVIHIGGRSELTVTIDGAVTVWVHVDCDNPVDAGMPMSLSLQVVEALADRWGSQRDASGTSVWFTIDLGRQDAGSDAGPADHR